MCAESFDVEDMDLDLDFSSSEEEESDFDGSCDPSEWRLCDDGAYHPIDELDEEEEQAQALAGRRPPPLPPRFQVDPVHLDILELPERLRSRQSAAYQLLSEEDKEGLWKEDGSLDLDHPLAERALHGDAGALIQPPELRRFGAELRAVINMLGTASLWLRSADPSLIPPEAQGLVAAHTFGLLSSVQHFPPPNEAGTFDVPPSPPVASGSAATSSAGPSSSTAGEPSSSSKRRRRRHRH
jgi:hypothetical protein